MCRTTTRYGPVRLAVATLALVVPLASPLRAEIRREPPIAVSAAAPNRQALIVTPGDGRLAADTDAYRDLLRRLGFEVETLAAESRVDLAAELRRFPGSVRPSAEVLILVLGTTLARDGDLFVTAASPKPEVVAQPALYGVEGVRLGAAIRGSAARDLVVIVDACRAAEDASCGRAAAGLGESISGIIASRATRPAATDTPLAGVASLRGDLIPLMREPGLSLLATFEKLRDRLKGTDMVLAATPALSRSFVFLPTDFLARLPTPCNAVERGTDTATLGGRDLVGQADACASAARTWDFSTHFTDKLAIVREQIGARRAVAACQPSDPGDAYLRAYPNGAYRGEVERFKARCDDEARAAATSPPPPPPPPVETQRRREVQLVPRGDQAASFSCDGPLREPVAQLICADAELAAADFGLGFAYRMVVRGSLFPEERRAAMSDQRAWLGRRDAACGIPGNGDWSLDDLARFKPCLLAEIEKRTRELSR